ncbi:Stp1/IreP family PP2C-type Ser/Thr phosphatase [Paenibacillus hamazuiensis]|uniref:Stp1/IreP family PP2C-type Ser/Thr phosphatase n=1 Tax=Paenibacillus hamazuiensis TaxID=2936508 RepID=UPI00200CAEDE|nr:Stp1/IreP family PP2C-type Ser/Thr phosphatase [Paenibacillus hamazuiensis]
MKMAVKTDIGRVRMVNEDRAVVLEDVGGFTLAIVADGMGGHQAGDIASQMAIEQIQLHLQSIHTGMSREECKDAVKYAIETANENIYEFASQRENYHGMGTTVVVAAAALDHIVIGHIGDSRAYRINPGLIEQLTEDHSLVNELVKSGQISREEASHHPRRNVLTRALGTEPTIEVDVQEIEWVEGEFLLICSDGLSSLVSKDDLIDTVLSEGTLDEKADRLVQRALDAGGDDNVTVILVKNESEPSIHGEKG